MEAQIGRVKDILVSMQRDQTYRETKMRLIHKLSGMAFLAMCLNGDDATNKRHWFKGYHEHSSREDVLTRLQTGKPMSCFRTSNSETNEVHVAFTDGEERHSTVSYVTLIYDTSLAVQETGVHFCPFIIKTDDGSDEPMVTRTEKNVLRDEAVEYALLLPYQTDNTADSFVQFERFTLVYWDWEVLQPGAEANKGRPSADPSVFQGMNPERGDD